MISPRSTEFLPVTPLIAAHVVSGLVAVGAGAGAMLTSKGSHRHRRCGLLYLASLVTSVLTATVLAAQEWAQRQHLFWLGVLALLLASIGYAARVRRPAGWVSIHIVGMGCSYITILTAFYVDNGSRLPIWQLLPEAAFWLLPSLAGIPFLVGALRKYRHSDFRA